MHTILIIGATGHIGGATAQALQNRGVGFSVLTRTGDGGLANNDKARSRQVLGDVRDRKSLEAAFSGFDAVLSVSPFAADIDQTGIAMVEAARTAGVKRFVRASALGASADAAMTLGRLHALAEAAVRDSGLAYTILQPATFMQNYLGMAASIRSENAFRSPLGHGRVSLVDIVDIGEAAATVLTEAGHEGKTYPLTGPEAVSCSQIAALMSEKFGRTIRYLEVSDAQADSAMREAGMPAELADMVSELNRASREGHAAGVSPAVPALLGREARTFSDFLEANARAFAA